MSWIFRAFVSSAVRRVAALLVVAVLAWLGVGTARAADQGEAYLEALQAVRDVCAAAYTGSTIRADSIRASFGSGHVVVSGRCYFPDGGYQGQHYANRAFDSTCASRPSQTTLFLPATGSTRCNRGCVIGYAQNLDGTSIASPTGAVCSDQELKENCPEGSFWNGYMSVCEPIQKQCPDGQEEKDGQCLPSNKCPAGMVSVQGSTPGAIQQGSLYCKPAKEECPPGDVTTTGGQCLPGEGKCAQGEARGGDGTCKRDADGDGVADDEDDNPDNDSQKDSFSGGDNCDAPPTCNGNPIMCGQARIQWRIDCNTRRAQNISGGTCDTVPICTGKACDAMEYAQLMQQWRSTCALEKIANQEPGQGGGDNPQGDANGNGVADVLEGRLASNGAGDGQADVDGSRNFGIGVNAGMLNSQAIFGAGSCPRPPSFQLYGQTISADDFPYWCDAMLILRGLVLLFGAFTALKILMGWGY